MVAQGLADLHAGRRTNDALAVLIASPRLRDLGFAVPDVERAECPELALFGLLEEERPAGAHAAYNAIIRLLVSFAEMYGLAARRSR